MNIEDVRATKRECLHTNSSLILTDLNEYLSRHKIRHRIAVLKLKEAHAAVLELLYVYRWTWASDVGYATCKVAKALTVRNVNGGWKWIQKLYPNKNTISLANAPVP
jgi:hypothetical protein